GIAMGSVARVPFAYFLGLNHAARWGAGEMARQWASLLLVLAGTALLGLRGACLGVAVAETAVLVAGVWWVRAHVSVSEVRLEWSFLAPYVEYNAAFFASTLLFAVCLRGGEALVRAAGGDYAKVGYFGVAASGWALAAQGMWMLLMSFLPLLTRLRAQGRLEAARDWAGRPLGALAPLLGPPLVPLVIGAAFTPVVPLLVPFSAALIAQACCSVGRLLALTLDQARLALAGVLTQAAVLAVLGLALGHRFGGVGMA